MTLPRSLIMKTTFGVAAGIGEAWRLAAPWWEAGDARHGLTAVAEDLQQAFQRPTVRNGAGEEQVGRPAGIAGPEARRRRDQVREQLQRARDGVLGGRGIRDPPPGGRHPCNPPQVVHMPSRNPGAGQMPPQACRQPAGTPGAAHVSVETGLQEGRPQPRHGQPAGPGKPQPEHIDPGLGRQPLAD